MNPKEIIYSDRARNEMKAGLDTVANAVKVTLGPRGRNVAIKKPWGGPVVTKDGVTVAREITLSNPFEDLGAQLCKQVASRTNDVAGDGTTTATILAQAMVSEGMRYIANGGNAVAVKRGIDKAVAEVVAYLMTEKKIIKHSDKAEVEFVATISGNDSEVGKTVADAFIKVGENGVVTFEEGKGTTTTLEVVEGLSIDRGYIAPHFITDPGKNKVEYNDPLILFWDKRITSANELIPLLNSVAGIDKPFLIIADDVEGEALGTLVLNKMNGVLKVVAVKAPGFGERRKSLMQDMALVTGGTFFSEEMGTKLETVSITKLGKAKKIIVTKDETTIIDGAGNKEELAKHVSNLKAQIEEVDSKYDKEKISERIAKLSGGVSIIRVGAASDAEMNEKKFRFEDAISATKAALEQGIIIGGGVPLMKASLMLDKLASDDLDEKAGIDIVKRALSVPIMTIASNAGFSGEVVAEKIKESKKGIGFNAKTGQYVDMMKAGIVDPVKVTKSAIENAASIAGIFLTTEALIVDAPKEEKTAPSNPYSGMI